MCKSSRDAEVTATSITAILPQQKQFPSQILCLLDWEHFGVSFTDTTFCKQTNKQILHSYLKQIFLLCLPSFLLLYRPSLLLWLPFIPALSQSVWCSRWTGRTLPNLICHAFCTILPCSSLIIWADPWNNLFTSSLVTQKEASDTHAYKAVDVRLYMENFYSCREREQTTQIKELLYSHIRRTSCLVDF